MCKKSSIFTMIFTHYYLLLDNDLAGKKIHKFSLFSVHCPTGRQVPLVLKSIFIFRTLTPNVLVVFAQRKRNIVCKKYIYTYILISILESLYVYYSYTDALQKYAEKFVLGISWALYVDAFCISSRITPHNFMVCAG